MTTILRFRLRKDWLSKELFSLGFHKEQPLEEALNSFKQNTRRFAKRQLTWFRNRMTVLFLPDWRRLLAERGFFFKI